MQWHLSVECLGHVRSCEAIPMSYPAILQSSTSASTLRSPSDITLCVVFAELSAARSANRVDRSTPRSAPSAGSHRDRLLISLEACAAALAQRNLPIPPSIRDELRLRRRLWSERC
jgi:hypothetical protein